MAELASAVDGVLLGLGDGVNRVEHKTYRPYQRLRNFACLCPPQRSKLLVYLKVDPKELDLVPGFTRDVATRYDKRGYVFLGTATTAALLIWLRS